MPEKIIKLVQSLAKFEIIDIFRRIFDNILELLKNLFIGIGVGSPTSLKFERSRTSHTDADKQVLKQFEKIIENTSKNIDNFEFGQALHDLYNFFWHDFCDCYLESSKVQMASADLKENTQQILIYILSDSLKLLHPFIPHATEEIWSKMPIKGKSALIIEKWPTI